MTRIHPTKYDYVEIQKLIDIGNSYRSLKKLVGISSATLWKAHKKGWINIPKNNQEIMIEKGIISSSHPHSVETKNLLSEQMSGRIRKNIRFSRMENYKGVWLDSSYESILVRDLEKNNIIWNRPRYLRWDDNGQIRRYHPDFYLPYYDVYLDPKNDFLIKKDNRKITLTAQQNNVRIIILNKNELTWEKVLERIMGA